MDHGEAQESVKTNFAHNKAPKPDVPDNTKPWFAQLLQFIENVSYFFDYTKPTLLRSD